LYNIMYTFSTGRFLFKLHEMEHKQRLKIKISSCLFLINMVLFGQVVSPFNKRAIQDTALDYSFIVSGHFHGRSESLSTFPAGTVLGNIDTLNALHPLFLMSLGDLFLNVNDIHVQHYQKSLFDKLKMPLFNSVGNHDLSNGNRYEKEYGKSFFSFIHNTELFIVLNTEVNDGDIKGEQLEMLKTAIADASRQAIRHIFIFSHRPVWSEGHPVYSKLFKDNTKSQIGLPNYKKEIQPLIEHSSIPIYWISGSLGDGPASFFYDKDPSGITFMQTAIRDLPRDAVLIVQVKAGNISFQGVSLTGEQLQPIENYNVDYWTKNIASEVTFNYRLLPYLTLQVITHSYFWIGLICGGLLILVLIGLIKKWKRKK
jgi:hypothetical protein